MGFGIVTGKTGTPHITSYEDAVRNAMLMGGKGKYILGVGNRLNTEVISTSSGGLTLRVKDGFVINQGRLMGIDLGDSDEIFIEAESVSETRTKYACLVARYTKNRTTGIESGALTVVYGELSDNPVLPDTYNNDLLDEDNIIDDVIIAVFTITNLIITKDADNPAIAKVWEYTGWDEGAVVLSYIGVADLRLDGNRVTARGRQETPYATNLSYQTYFDIEHSVAYNGFIVGRIDDKRYYPKQVVTHRFSFTRDGEVTPPPVSSIITGELYVTPTGEILVNPDVYASNYEYEFRLCYDDLSWFTD